MADLRELIRTVHATPGVRAAVAAGRDGLLIDAAGVDGARAEHVAALAPGLTRAAEQIGDAARQGAARAIAVEGAEGVLLAMPLSDEVTVVALVDGAEGPARVGEALHALRAARARLAALT